MSETTLPENFDPEVYLALNPDVRNASVDPVEHYLKQGHAEGRSYRKLDPSHLPPDFDPNEYLNANPDLLAAGVNATDHYLTSGHSERRPHKPMSQLLKPGLAGRYDGDGLISIHNHDFMQDPAFTAAYQRGCEAAGDYQWQWRVHIGLWAAHSALRVNGDFVECGVNRGFLSSAIMSSLDWDQTGRTFYLLDTFNGIDPRYVSDEERSAGVLDRNARELAAGFYTSNLELVKKNFSEWRHTKLIAGPIPETLGRIDAAQVAFVHIDLNCSPPEVAALDAIWPRMPTGAIVLLDDYAYYGYQTQKNGMDLWAKAHRVPIASLPTGQGLIVKA